MDAPPRDDEAGSDSEDDAAPMAPPPTPREGQETQKRPLRRLAASGLGMLICRQQGRGADGGRVTTIAAVDPGGAAHASGKLAAGDVLLSVDGIMLAAASSLACAACVAPVAPPRGAAPAPLTCPCHAGCQCSSMDDHTLHAKLSGPAGTKVLLCAAREGSQHRQVLYLNPATDSMKLVLRCQGMTAPCAHSETGVC